MSYLTFTRVAALVTAAVVIIAVVYSGPVDRLLLVMAGILWGIASGRWLDAERER